MPLMRLALMLSAIAATPIGAAPVSPDKLQLSECFNAQMKKTPFTGIVAASDGKQLFVRAVGKADGAGRVLITDRTPFRLASVQKVMTRIAIGQLAEKGLVSFDAPVGTYVKELPPQMAAVTIDQLLQHRSGVAPLTLPTDDDWRIIGKAVTARDLLPVITSQPLSFPPGQKREYSNGGYFLLGVVIEEVSGLDYSTYLRNFVFRPLGMTSTSLVANARTAVSFTKFFPDGPPLARARPLPGGNGTRGNPAGDGISSARDMLKLGRALATDRLFSRTTETRLFPPQAAPWRVGQSGGGLGVNTDFAVFPDSGWVVVTLSNYDPPAGELMGEVMRTMASTKTCHPLGPQDRPSPFRMLTEPTKK